MARVATGPWFRKSKNTLYATHLGEKVSLKVRGEENEEEARRPWHRLMAGLPVEAGPDAEKPADVKPQASLAKQTPDAFTLPELVKLFLADVEGRVDLGWRSRSITWQRHTHQSHFVQRKLSRRGG